MTIPTTDLHESEQAAPTGLPESGQAVPGDPPVSVFADVSREIFQTIEVEIQFVDRVVGGQPKDPQLVQGWLRKNMGLAHDDKQELFELTRRHLLDMGIDQAATATDYDDLVAISESLTDTIKTQGFKRDVAGRPCIEARHIKAGIKESVNVLYAGLPRAQGWGATKKGPRAFTAERVFVRPLLIPVGEAGDVKTDTAIGHIDGPKGPQSTIGQYEYVETPSIAFRIQQLLAQNTANREPSLDELTWAKVWAHMEYNGLGAMRSQSFGQFVVTKFEVVAP